METDLCKGTMPMMNCFGKEPMTCSQIPDVATCPKILPAQFPSYFSVIFNGLFNLDKIIQTIFSGRGYFSKKLTSFHPSVAPIFYSGTL